MDMIRRMDMSYSYKPVLINEGIVVEFKCGVEIEQQYVR